jgi:uncharacterized membrane protein YheB (UPF0754 family)
MALSVEGVTLSIIVGTLAAIVYSLRVLVILERRIARMDLNLESLVKQIMAEELKIEKKLGGRTKKRKRK